MDSKRKHMQHGVSSASDQLSTRLNLVTTLTHGFWPSYKSCCSTKHAPPHLDIIFTHNKNPMISNLMKQLIAQFWHADIQNKQTTGVWLLVWYLWSYPWSRELWHHQEVTQRASSHQYCKILVKQWKLETIAWVFPSLPSSLEAHKFPNFMSMSINVPTVFQGEPLSLSTCSERLITTRTQIQFQICQDPRDHWRTPLFSKIIEGQTLYIPQRHCSDLSIRMHFFPFSLSETKKNPIWLGTILFT